MIFFWQLTFIVFCCFQLIIAQGNSKPQNIIILIGDGFGVNHIAVSVLSDEQNPFKEFTTIGLANNKSANNLITDSGAAATAIATGYPTNNLYISVDSENNPLLNVFELAKSKGLSTGIVVTCDVVHATPACFFAHNKDRNNKELLALQSIDAELDVMIGGGTDYYLPSNLNGKRSDNFNLINELIKKGYNYFDNYDELKNSKTRKKFFALFEKDALPKAPDRNYSLGDLTQIALDNLSQNKNGFILMIEGSQIDWAGHDNDSNNLLAELNDFNTAINTCLKFAKKNPNTLIIITADHETGGMAIEEGNLDGTNLKLDFTSTSHTGGLIPVLAKGPGEELFKGFYNNCMIGRKLFLLIDPEYDF